MYILMTIYVLKYNVSFLLNINFKQKNIIIVIQY
jgi:hypothetical protein